MDFLDLISPLISLAGIVFACGVLWSNQQRNRDVLRELADKIFKLDNVVRNGITMRIAHVEDAVVNLKEDIDDIKSDMKHVRRTEINQK